MSELIEFRKAKDHFFKVSPNSPLEPSQQQAFSGIPYYDEDPDLRYELNVEKFNSKETVNIQTSTDEYAEYISWGKISFSLHGEECTLTLFKQKGTEGFFLPFADGTTRIETYSSGRYLDVNVLANGQILLDFNLAYNPNCAYNQQWSCPITPPENRIKPPVRAGEKTPYL